ncbi:MAG: DUF2791 family P-loop domain-containing protein [Thermoplasmata archaeon]
MSSLPDKGTARVIIEKLGGEGVPPEYGFQFFTVGLDCYLSIIDKEYLSSYIQQGGAAFKLVMGVYGCGKTHFLYCVREIAWERNFVVSYVPLNPNSCPFHRPELVYREMVKNITLPQQPTGPEMIIERGIESFLKGWIAKRTLEMRNRGITNEEVNELIRKEIENIRGVENRSFANAIREACRAILEHSESNFDVICQWLEGEMYDRQTLRPYGINERIGRTNAFSMIRSLAQCVREMGYSGLVILFDETEMLPSLAGRDRENHLINLRELIDRCAHTDFRGVMIFYACPDINFIEGGRGIAYQALAQRVETMFDELNPTGVKIDLEKLPVEPKDLLRNIGKKLKDIYEIATESKLDPQKVDEVIEGTIQEVIQRRFEDTGHRRLFVQTLIERFHHLKRGEVLDDLKIKK